jgi:hypothetical protein
METREKALFVTGQVGVAVEWLEKCGIDPAPLLGAIAGDVAAIDSMSQALLAAARDYQSGAAPLRARAELGPKKRQVTSPRRRIQLQS